MSLVALAVSCAHFGFGLDGKIWLTDCVDTLKILHVIETLAIGGAERLLVMLLPELKRRGDDVAVAVLREPLDIQPTLEEAGLVVHVLPAHHKWNVAAGARSIARVARENEFDIIHAHLYFPAVYTGFAQLLGLTSAKTCVTFHNLAYRPGVNKPGVKLGMRKRFARLAYRRGIDRLIAVSSSVAVHYEEVLGVGEICVIHNSVDLEAIDRVIPPDTEQAEGGELHVVVPGRLVHEKGHGDFLDALRLLRQRDMFLKVTIAGGGPLHRDLERRIEVEDFADDVSITGLLDFPEMLATMARASIVVIPSRFEGFGLTALEAMALSRPVIATGVGGLTEIITHQKSGLLVAPESPAALADAIERLGRDPDLRSVLAAAGRKSVEARFALPAIADQLRSVYAELCQEEAQS